MPFVEYLDAMMSLRIWIFVRCVELSAAGWVSMLYNMLQTISLVKRLTPNFVWHIFLPSTRRCRRRSYEKFNGRWYTVLSSDMPAGVQRILGVKLKAAIDQSLCRAA